MKNPFAKRNQIEELVRALYDYGEVRRRVEALAAEENPSPVDLRLGHVEVGNAMDDVIRKFREVLE